jgi:hypothetical protein
VEFAAKDAAAKKLMAAKQRAARELEEKVACDAGYPVRQAYWRRRIEEAEAAAAAKRAATTAAWKEGQTSLPNHGSSLTLATKAPRLAAAQTIRGQEAGHWSPSTLARWRCFLP